jgi:hypothetical protein
MAAEIGNPGPLFVGVIYDRAGHSNGKVYLGSVDDCLEFVQIVRCLVPRVEIHSEDTRELMAFSHGIGRIGSLLLPPTVGHRLASHFMLPELEFYRAEEIRPWMRRFKTDLADLAERYRYRALAMMMSLAYPLKREEIALLVWAAQTGTNLLPYGYRDSLSVVQDILMLNDEDF